MNHRDQSNLVGFIWLTLPQHRSSLMGGSRSRKADVDANRGCGGELLTGLSPFACSTGFLIELRTTDLGIAPLTTGWAFLH